MNSDDKKQLKINELATILNVSKPTVYSRSKALNIELNGYYSEAEIQQLKQPKKRQKSKVVKRKVKLENNFTTLPFNQQNIVENELREQIKQLKNQLKVKDQQIAEANKLADQAQQLQADLQNKLESRNQELIELKQTQKRGFWYNLFHSSSSN